MVLQARYGKIGLQYTQRRRHQTAGVLDASDKGVVVRKTNEIIVYCHKADGVVPLSRIVRTSSSGLLVVKCVLCPKERGWFLVAINNHHQGKNNN